MYIFFKLLRNNFNKERLVNSYRPTYESVMFDHTLRFVFNESRITVTACK